MMVASPRTWRISRRKYGRSSKKVTVSSMSTCSFSSGVRSASATARMIGEQLVAPSRQGLGQEMLLVLEEEVDGGRRESGLVCDLPQGPIVYAACTEDLFGRIEDVDPVLAALGLALGPTLGPAVRLGCDVIERTDPGGSSLTMAPLVMRELSQ